MHRDGSKMTILAQLLAILLGRAILLEQKLKGDK